MNALSLLYWHVFLLQFALSLFILLRNPKAFLNQICALLLGCFAFWCLEMTIVHKTDITPELALWVTKIFSVFWISSASVFLLFVHAFVKKVNKVKNRWLWLLLIVPPLVFAAQSWQNNLLYEFVPHTFGWYGLFRKDSVWSYLFYFYYSIYCICGLFLLFQYRRQEKEALQRKQAGTLLIGAGMTFVMSATAEFLLPQLGIHWFEDSAAMIAAVWSVSVVYAITRYQFLPITPMAAAENILAAMSDALFLVDNTGRIIDVNKAAINMFGFQKQELQNKQFHELLSAGEKDAILPKIQEEIKELELGLISRQGEVLPVSLSISIIKDPFQRPAGFVYVARDITEQKRMNTALRESEHRYQELAESLPLAVWEADQEGYFTYVNKAGLALMGLTEQDIKQGVTIKSIINKVYWKQVDEKGEQLYKEKTPYTVSEYIGTRRDGREVPVRIITRVLKRDGQAVGLVGLAEDIFERRQMEEKAREAAVKLERQLRFTEALISAIPTPVFFKDADGYYLGCNAAFAEYTGIPPEELKGKTVFEAWPRENAEIFYKMDQELQRQQTHQRYETKILDYRGRMHDVVFEKDVFCDEFGEVAGLVGALINITEIRHVEEQVRKMNVELEKRVYERTTLLASLLDSIPDLVFFKDLQGVYLGCNPAFAGYAGKSREEIIGKTDDELFSASKAGVFRKHDALVLQQDQVHRSELTLEFDDGRYVPVEMQKAPLKDLSGTVIGLLGVAHDITDTRRHAFELKQAKEAAENANQAKSQFLANMSHEIRTPLHGIIGFLKLLVNTPVSEEQLEYIQGAQSASTALLHLINEILDFSRIEAAKLNLQPEVFNLREAVEETAFLLSTRAFEKNLELITHIEQDVPCKVVGDRARLKQILNNLIENAIKFTEQGEVFINVKRRYPGDIDRPDASEQLTVQFEIQDTGIGIDKEDGERLFLPFSQLDSSTTRRYGGTGLGLAISKKLIEMMGGQIKLQSEKGRGSRFIFSINFEQVEQPASQNYNLSGVRVLVVDDNLTQCQVLEAYLKDAGCEVSVTHDGSYAIKLLTEESGATYRFILIDNLLPGMMSHLLVQTVKNNNNTHSADIIMLNGSSTYSSQAETVVEAGVLTTLHKPVRKEQLLSCLSGKLLKNGQSFSPELKERPAASGKENRGFTILVVEDNELNSRLMVKLLNKWGYSCETAKNGQEALDVCRERNYNLILMDCQMPVMDGYEATTAIRQLEGNDRHTTIIGLTAHALSGDREKCLAVGMDEYISKPFDFGKLAEMLESYKQKQL